MPRQPYLPSFRRLHYALGPSVIKERPDHLASIGRCIAVWSHVDHELGNLFGEALSRRARGEVIKTKLDRYLFVYRLADLEAISVEMEEFWHTCFSFNQHLREPQDPGRAEEFQHRCTLPQMAREIARQANDGKSSS